MADNTSNIEKQIQPLIVDLDWKKPLDKWLNKFNVFSILQIEGVEIRHSNFLAWLFNPKESHGLGDSFLKRVFIDDEKIEPKKKVREWNDFKVEREQLTDDKDRLDLLLVSNDLKVVIAIENKIGAPESKDQLKKYRESIQNKYRDNDWTKCYYFLTPEGREGTTDPEVRWETISYEDIINALQIEYDYHKDSMRSEAKLLIENYIDSIKANVIIDKDLVTECSNILAKYPCLYSLKKYFKGFSKETEKEETNSTLLKDFYFQNKAALDKIFEISPNYIQLIYDTIRGTKKNDGLIDKFNKNKNETNPNFFTKIDDNISEVRVVTNNLNKYFGNFVSTSDPNDKPIWGTNVKAAYLLAYEELTILVI